MKHWQGCGWVQLWMNLRSNPGICWRDREKSWKSSVKRAGAHAKLQTQVPDAQVTVSEPICSVTDVQNYFCMSSGFHYDMRSLFFWDVTQLWLVGSYWCCRTDLSVSNHKSMCNIQEEDRPQNNFFLGILQNILLILFHGLIALGIEKMFKFCGENPGFQTAPSPLSQ